MISEILAIFLGLWPLLTISRKGKGGVTADNTLGIKGYMAIMVMFGHYYGGYYFLEGMRVYPYPEILKQMRAAFQDTGFLWVSMFFMYSAYGVREGLIYKAEYLQSFILKRLKKIYLPFLIIDMVACFVLKIFFHNPQMNLKQLILNCVNVNLFPVQWFVIAIMGFYMVFYVIYSNWKIEEADKIICGVIGFFLVFCYCANISETYYVSHVGILVGISYSRYKEKIDFIGIKYKSILFLLCMSIFLLIFNYPYLFWPYGYRNAILDIGPLYRMMSCIIICILALLLNINYACNKSRILRFLGSISYEIYLIHTIIEYIVRGVLTPALLKVENIYFNSNALGLLNILMMLVTVTVSFLIHGFSINKFRHKHKMESA